MFAISLQLAEKLRPLVENRNADERGKWPRALLGAELNLHWKPAEHF